MRNTSVVTYDETLGGPGLIARLTPVVPAVLGAILIAALGLWSGLFESGPSDGDLRAAYNEGLEAGGEVGLAAARADREAAREAEALSLRTEADPVYAALGPQMVPVNADPYGRGVVCGPNRCLDAGSGLSVHVIAVQGWFDPNRSGREAPAIAPARTQQTAPEANAVAQTSNDIWWAEMSERVGGGNAAASGDESVRCDQTQCTDVASGVSASLIRIQGWFNPSMTETFTPGRRDKATP